MIVYTRHDGGVSICHPSPEIISLLSSGGYFKHSSCQEYIERLIARGGDKYITTRFANALDRGGCTTAEAYGLIRDRDCDDGTGHEIWNRVPLDRWFRDAWRRSHNGGPIGIDLNLARPIQYRKIREAVELENKKFREPIQPDYGKIIHKINSAKDEFELQRIWPGELQNPF